MYPAAHPLYFGAELPTFENSNSFVFDVLPPTPTHTQTWAHTQTTPYPRTHTSAWPGIKNLYHRLFPFTLNTNKLNCFLFLNKFVLFCYFYTSFRPGYRTRCRFNGPDWANCASPAATRTVSFCAVSSPSSSVPTLRPFCALNAVHSASKLKVNFWFPFSNCSTHTHPFPTAITPRCACVSVTVCVCVWASDAVSLLVCVGARGSALRLWFVLRASFDSGWV